MALFMKNLNEEAQDVYLPQIEELQANQNGQNYLAGLMQVSGLAAVGASGYYDPSTMSSVRDATIVPVNPPPQEEQASTVTLTRTPVTASEVDIPAERKALAKEAASLLGYTELGTSITVEEAASRVAKVFEKLGFDPLDEKKVDDYKREVVRKLSNFPYEIFRWEAKPLSQYGGKVPEFALSRAIELKKELPEAEFLVEYVQRYPDPFLVMVVGSHDYYIDVWDEPKFEGRRTV